MTLLPAFETLTRIFNTNSIPASQVLVQHFTLWIGFIGAVLATRQNKLLALTKSSLFDQAEKIHFGKWIAKVITFLVLVALTWGSWELLKVEFQYPIDIAPYIPRWFAQIIMPLGFGLMALQVYFNSYKKTIHRISLVLIGFLFSINTFTDTLFEVVPVVWIGSVIILTALMYGAPIFVGLGGMAVLLFWADYTPISAIPTEAYRIVVSPTLPTIPLFTLAGYLLAESKASTRLVKVFHELFGWIPGGTPVIIVVLCGFFTALTGGSGVTILALGGLLLPLLLKEGYSRIFSLGLITVSGSLGLLFPPSLPAIIYGVTAGISVKDVFIAGLIPGLLLVLMMSVWALYQGKKDKIILNKFNVNEAISVCLDTKWELLIPILILFGVFGGFTTLVETAALTVLYVFSIECYIYKDIKIQELPKIIIDCATLIGGVLIILGVAMGLTSYLVDAQIPILILSWAKEMIASKYAFLLMLNIFLLIVGCLMDIFSAIIVIVPLIAPLGAYFGIDPVHLAIIFIANLELGFLTPPVGMNLFLAAYRFDEDMPKIYRATLPFFLVRLLAVGLITYIPVLTLGLLS
ncbi:MAG: C4-dicarboxylate ABC transporter permease [Candidatus Marinimicrobia bacterium]|nr:C4-dicarboxylate ABC transporter permease [Candidatus Neomarinimicrobiota bacterium]